jgi:hypothetical protein
MAYSCTAISCFLRAVLATSELNLTFLPVARFARCLLSNYAAPFLMLLVPNGSLVSCEPIEVYHHPVLFQFMTHNKTQTIMILVSVGAS